MADPADAMPHSRDGYRGRAVPSARAAIVGLLLTLACSAPWLFSGVGLGQLPVLSGIIAWRSLLTAILLLGVFVLALVGWIFRRSRRVIGGLLISLIPLVTVAGLASWPAQTHVEAGPAGDDVMTVLSWNVNGSLVDAATLLQEVAQHDPDVVVLPSIGDEILKPLARALSERGYTLVRPKGSETAILTLRGDKAASEGDYGVERSSEAVAEAAGSSFEIVAVHLRIPFLPGGNHAWADESRWLGSICDAQRPAIIVGDFNATDDNFAGTSLRSCQDAAASVGAQNVGTWPTRLPVALGIPIDHLLVSGDAAKILDFEVLRDEDDSGARHRPILVTLEFPPR